MSPLSLSIVFPNRLEIVFEELTLKIDIYFRPQMTSYPDNQTFVSDDDVYCFEIFMPEVLNVTTWSQMNQVSARVGLQKAENFSAEDLLYFLISGQFLHSLEVLEISRQKADGRFIMFSINNIAHILQGGFIVFMDMTLTLLSVLANIMVISAVRDRYAQATHCESVQA